MLLKIIALAIDVNNNPTPIIIAEIGKQKMNFDSLTHDIYTGKINNGKYFSVAFKF